MMRSIAALITVLLIVTGFVVSSKQQEYHPSKGEQLVNSILAKTAKIIKEKHNIKPCGVGVAMPGGPIQELTLCFDTKYPYSKEQLRELLIKSADELLNQVSENEEIQEFLKFKPFSINNIEIVIYNHDKDGLGLNDPQISVANVSHGGLTYRTVDPEDNFKYKKEIEETYEEALKAISKP